MDTAAAECERQADGQRGETEGEKRENERGEKNVGDMKICEGAREQSGTCEKCRSVFFFIALLWQHVWNWNVIRCLVWLLSLASTHSHPSQHTWKAALFNCWNNRLISSSLSFLLIFLTSEWCDTVLFLNFFRLLFCSLFLWPLRIKQGIKYDSSSVLQLETCESLWECGGVQNLPSLCERVKSQAGGSEYVWTIYVFSRHITPHPNVAGVWGRIVLSDRFQAWKQPRSHFWHQQLAVIAMTLSHWWEKGGNKSRLLRLKDRKAPEGKARKSWDLEESVKTRTMWIIQLYFQRSNLVGFHLRSKKMNPNYRNESQDPQRGSDEDWHLYI